MNKKKMIAAAVASLGIATVVGVGVAGAQTSSGQTLADKIATKFNLDKNQVQQVIDQDHADHRAQMDQRFEDRLNQAVTDKKITSEQKDKILAKHKELEAQRQADRDALKDKTPAERKAAFDQKKAELEQWAKDNNVPLEYLMPGRGGHGMGMHRGMMGPDGPAPNAQ